MSARIIPRANPLAEYFGGVKSNSLNMQEEQRRLLRRIIASDSLVLYDSGLALTANLIDKTPLPNDGL